MIRWANVAAQVVAQILLRFGLDSRRPPSCGVRVWLLNSRQDEIFVRFEDQPTVADPPGVVATGTVDDDGHASHHRFGGDDAE